METITRWAVPVVGEHDSVQWEVHWTVFSVLRVFLGWVAQTESTHLELRLYGCFASFFVIQNLIRPFFHILEIDASRLVVYGIKERIFLCILDSYETYRESLYFASILTTRGRKRRKTRFREHWSSSCLISFETLQKWLNVQWRDL